MVGMTDLQNERKLMAMANRKIDEALRSESPGQSTSSLMQSYSLLSTDIEKAAFVAVLASRAALWNYASASAKNASPVS
jgi:hypothetical protein